MKKITVLGSTGSIGTQSLEVIKAHPDRFRVEALTCGKNKKKLEEQIEKFRPAFAVTEREEDAHDLMRKFPRTEFSWGEKGLIEAAEGGCDMVLNALMGMRGLAPTYAAIQAGKDIALANKETLVAGGELVMDAAAKAGVKLLPVDSEHSAIFQCLEGNKNRPVKKILLTASGGPFRGYTKEQLENVTLAQALKHPKWNMGAKITIDSATMMNKGLEVIEAMNLFNLPQSKIDVIIHRESVIHSFVEFVDKSVIACMSMPNMRLPVQLAMTYPDRIESYAESLDLAKLGSLHFEYPDYKKFKCLSLCIDAAKLGESACVAVSAADEIAVAQFIAGKIGFTDIEKYVEKGLSFIRGNKVSSVDEVLSIDETVKKYIRQTMR